MIAGLPPKAVLKAAAEEQLTLEEDLASGRTMPSDDTASIFTFCRFLEGALHGSLVLPRTMPMEHWTFYLKIVGRLVAAEELPCQTKDDIEAAFRDVFCCIMA
ncbi:MAG TPA: hypothetical protein VN836_05345 [Verrucomicrobiae bacterium]|nr:hypothetical protein [Verrucomicrobiae bacterium]